MNKLLLALAVILLCAMVLLAVFPDVVATAPAPQQQGWPCPIGQKCQPPKCPINFLCIHEGSG